MVTITINKYSVFFDEASTQWKKDFNYNVAFLLRNQDEFNVKLRTEGFVFLNDIYKSLGLQPKKSVSTAGWIFNEGSYTYIDAMITEPSMDGKTNMFLLTFNCEDDIRKNVSEEIFEAKYKDWFGETTGIEDKKIDCIFCDPDKYGRQPMIYETKFIGGYPFFTNGLFIHLENGRPQLSSYLLNAELDDIVDDRIDIKYCPICGRKLDEKYMEVE